VDETVSQQAEYIYRLRFTIRTLLVLTASVALFLALRIIYVFPVPSDGGMYFNRGKDVAYLFAGLGALYACVISHANGLRKRGMVLRAVLHGAAAALVCSAVLGIECAERFRRVYPEYWQWPRDWAEFAGEVILWETFVGSVVALSVALLWTVTCCASRLFVSYPPVDGDVGAGSTLDS